MRHLSVTAPVGATVITITPGNVSYLDPSLLRRAVVRVIATPNDAAVYVDGFYADIAESVMGRAPWAVVAAKDTTAAIHC